MSTLKCYYKSFYVGYPVAFTAIVPQKKHVVNESSSNIKLGSFKTSYPVLFLLHDETDSPIEWMKQTRLEKYANDKGIIIIMPEGKRSFYSEYEYRDRPESKIETDATPLKSFTENVWDAYIGLELVPYIRKILPVSDRKKETFIGGVGMGGFGALKLGLKYSELFGSIFSLSGLMDLQWAMDNITEKKEQFEVIFGGLNVKDASEDDFDYQIREKIEDGTMPKFYQSFTSLGDDYKESNLILNNKIQNNSFDYKFIEDNEELNWDYLDRKITEVLDWLI